MNFSLFIVFQLILFQFLEAKLSENQNEPEETLPFQSQKISENLDVNKTSKLDSVLEHLNQKNSHILQTLHELRIKADTKLSSLFPQLSAQIESLHSINDECYDQTVGFNRTINIFQDFVHDIVVGFFSEHQTLHQHFKISDIPKRVKTFLENLKTLAHLVFDCITDRALGKPTTKLGLTSLAIYSQKEFETKMLNPNLSRNVTLPKRGDIIGGDPCSLRKKRSEKIPDTFNWDEQGYVTPVYNQLGCQSCYVFSTTSAMESQYMINVKKEVVHFSVQSTLNCMSNGCDGGMLPEPLQHFIDRGAVLEEDDPYTSSVSECRIQNAFIKADHYCYHTALHDNEMQLTVLRNGPSAVAISGKKAKALQFLRSEWNMDCGDDVDHAVLLVGWDQKNWIIKNSWGPYWGIKGYLHLPRGENKCGVNTMIGVPLIFKR